VSSSGARTAARLSEVVGGGEATFAPQGVPPASPPPPSHANAQYGAFEEVAASAHPRLLSDGLPLPEDDLAPHLYYGEPGTLPGNVSPRGGRHAEALLKAIPSLFDDGASTYQGSSSLSPSNSPSKPGSLLPSRASASRPTSAAVKSSMRQPSASTAGSRPPSAKVTIGDGRGTPSITPLDGGGGPAEANPDFHLGVL